MCVGMGRQEANIDGWIGCANMCVCVSVNVQMDGWRGRGDGGREMDR